MKGGSVLITAMTDDVPPMVQFYRHVLGFQIEDDMGQYVEFAHKGVCFAICDRAVLAEATRAY